MNLIREEFLNESILILIGAIVSLIGALLLYFLQQIIYRFLKRRGEVSLYYKHVYDLMNEDPASFKENHHVLTIPLWIEIHNNKEVNQIVRNVNLSLYKSGVLIDKATQINRIEKEEDKVYLGNNGSYSFNLPAESINQFEVYYLFNKTKENQEFDTVYLTYYTSKSKVVSTKILDIPEGWQTKSLSLNKDWNRGEVKINKLDHKKKEKLNA